MRKRSFEKLVDETFESFDSVKRAEPKAFLLTRVMASVNGRQAGQNIWTKAAAFISRPGIAIAGLLLIVLVNTTIVVISKNNRDQKVLVQSNFAAKDEFAINAAAIYDIENPE